MHAAWPSFLLALTGNAYSQPCIAPPQAEYKEVVNRQVKQQQADVASAAGPLVDDNFLHGTLDTMMPFQFCCVAAGAAATLRGACREWVLCDLGYCKGDCWALLAL